MENDPGDIHGFSRALELAIKRLIVSQHNKELILRFIHASKKKGDKRSTQARDCNHMRWILKRYKKDLAGIHRSTDQVPSRMGAKQSTNADIYGNFKDEDMVNSIYEKTGLKMKAEDIQLKATQCPRCMQYSCQSPEYAISALLYWMQR